MSPLIHRKRSPFPHGEGYGGSAEPHFLLSIISYLLSIIQINQLARQRNIIYNSEFRIHNSEFDNFSLTV